jgi:hypothetical protein
MIRRGDDEPTFPDVGDDAIHDAAYELVAVD